ncbi:ATP-binding protein [Bacillus sinesaloumensis]|uniref:ATP-binding protein n=1 Tax=Litchfieldia sinesaloumensis TaxID=1926280 RepID=UPI0009884C75|nr:ATP-binding protein [Bacillus sinesaloumensis]
MNIVKDFLLQVTLLVIPIFVYFTFITEKVKSEKNRNVVMCILWGLSVLLCMLFPVDIGKAVQLDLRIIPLLLGSLYGGILPTIILTSVILLFRLYLGTNVGLYNTVLVLIVFLPVLLFIQRSFVISKKEKRIAIAVVLSVIYCAIGITFSIVLRGFDLDTFSVQLTHLLFVALVTFFLVTLYETIRDIHRLRSEMQDTERLRLISQLSTVFAHEIRNPMQVTRGFLQLLDEPDLPKSKKQYIQISIDELDRANQIIYDFLSFGSPSTNIEKVDVGYQLQRVANIIKGYTLNQNVDIKLDVQENCWIHANPQKLNQSLINILKNAVESMPNGGSVWITCFQSEDGFIEVTIKDEGIGMTPKQLKRLGSPYYSLKEKGTGLGMMVSMQIIHSLNGKIKVTSEEGIGTEITIQIPGWDRGQGLQN